MDEIAHVATAWLLLAAAVGPAEPPAWTPWALLGAVAVDVDHVPLYADWQLLPPPDGRPVSHSLGTVAVLAGVALGGWGRWRRAFGGLAVGVLLHLARDTASGPGVPLWWPLPADAVRLPYAAPLTVLALAAAVVAVRSHRSRRPAVSDDAAG